jgi:hypothetical protein
LNKDHDKELEQRRAQVEREAKLIREMMSRGKPPPSSKPIAALQPRELTGSPLPPSLGCDITFSFTCAQRWQSLSPTDNPNERFCESCSMKVVLCITREQVEAASSRKQCVSYQPVQEKP